MTITQSEYNELLAHASHASFVRRQVSRCEVLFGESAPARLRYRVESGFQRAMSKLLAARGRKPNAPRL